METNPFHNGHKYFLEQARAIAKDNLLVCIISTNIVQRGEISVLNKHIKTKLLLESGVDIVCELPAVYANQGGAYFALGALKILQNFKITNLIFGSESADLQLLIDQSEKLETADFKQGINSNLDQLLSNDILGISYIRAATKLGLNLEFDLVKRINNNYNQEQITSKIASATSIRANLHDHELVRDALPSEALANICTVDEQLLFKLFKVNLLNYLNSETDIFLSENNQLLIRMQKIIIEHNPESIKQFLELCKDRNNSKYKYSRIMINVVLGVKTDDYLSYDYLRILGFNRKVSKLIPSNSFTSLADNNSPIADIENRASHLFSMLTNDYQSNDFDRKPQII